MKTLGKMPSNFPNTGIRVRENLKKNVKLMYAQRQMNAKQPVGFIALKIYTYGVS